MPHYRFLKFFFVCLLLLSSTFTEKAGAGSLDFFTLQGLEKMSVTPPFIHHSGKDILFEPISDDILTLPSFNNSQWFRISMQDLLQELECELLYPDGEGILMFASSHITHVDCFIPETVSTYTRYTFGKASGNFLQFLYTRYPVLWLPSLKGFFKEGHIYFNVRSDYPVSARLHLLAPIPFIRFFFKSLIIQLTFLGVMIGFVITFLLFYTMTGKKNYRTFMLIQLGVTLFAASFNGLLYAYLKLPASISILVTWLSFGLGSIMGSRFFLNGLQEGSPSRKFYKLVVRAQYILAALILITAIKEHCLWTYIGSSIALSLSFTGFVLLFLQMIRTGAPKQGLVLYVGSNIAIFAGLGIMFLSTYYIPYYFPFASYPDVIYMALLLISPLLMILLSLFESRARFEGYDLLEAQSAHYRELSQKDGLTGLYNRSHLEHTLEEKVRQAEKKRQKLAFIMLDIDHFKRFNDTWGHQEGDRALAFVARIVRESLREQDLAARYGGEEFSVILSGASLSIATIVAERIRKSCEEHSPELGPAKSLTVSLGISLFRSGDTPATLIRRADEALYRAKENGRNRMELESS